MKLILKKPDTFGALASGLCMIHCMVTPLLFIVHSCAVSGCSEAPLWWRSVDYAFLAISFVAIHHSTRNTSSNWIKPAFWVGWTALFLIILNASCRWIALPGYAIYIPAIALVGLHIYNLNYCQCKNDKCCAQGTKLAKQF